MRTLGGVLVGMGLMGLASPAMAFDWNGFYAGVVAGYVSGTSTASYDTPDSNIYSIPFSSFDLDSNPSGGAIGLTLGANGVMDGGLVVGIEGDLSYGNVTDTIADDFATYRGDLGNEVTSSTDFSGTLRGRVGFDGGGFMPYLTAGIAGAHVTVNATDGDISDDATLYGWAAGGGIEVAVSDTFTVKGEYLYSDLGEHTWFDGELWSSTSHSTSHTVRIGLNFALD